MGSEAPVFFLERSWSSEGKSATSDGRPGEEAAVACAVLASALPANPGSLRDTCMILHPSSCVSKRHVNAAFCKMSASPLHPL